MDWRYTPYTLLLLAASAVALGLVLYVWRRREAPGAGMVILMLVAVFIWSLGYAFELGESGLGLKVFWAKVQYLGITTVPAAWLVFALRYTGRDRWLTRRNLALLTVIPLLTLALVWTNETHGLIWSRTTLDESRMFMRVDHGPFFWVYWIYSYVMLILGTFFLISAIRRSSRLYREQVAALLVAAAAPWVGNGAYVLDLNPVPDLDLTPFAFLFSGAVVSVGLFGFRLLDIVPVARDFLVEGMNDGVIVADPRGRVVDLNPAAQEILYRPNSSAVGMPLAELTPELGALVEGYSEAEEAHKEVTFGTDPDVRHYDLALSRLKDREGRLKGHLLVLRDVTERRAAERELLRQRIELAQSNAELEQFAYLIAHDLRAPLRGINGFSHILREDYAGTLDAAGRDYLERIGEGARRMGRMIDELLDLSRLTRMELRRQRVDLSALAEDVAEELRQGEPDRTVELIIEEGISAEGDRRLLRVALANLMDNAWKFTSRQPEARIEFGALRAAETPTYYVRDNGAGFDMAYSERMFGPFQRLHTSDEFEGAGIGLAAVARVIHRHGGRVWAEGEVGQGAAFYFTL